MQGGRLLRAAAQFFSVGAVVLAAAACWAVAAPTNQPLEASPPVAADAEVPEGFRPHLDTLKQRFVQGMEVRVDPRSITVTGVEVLPNRSYIVYLRVPSPSGDRLGALFGHCVEPAELGFAGGFVTGRDDPELVAQRKAAQAQCA